MWTFLSGSWLNHRRTLLHFLKNNAHHMIFCIIILAVHGHIAYERIAKQHLQYWGEETRTGIQQGTIYAVQTTHINIAAASYPYTLSALLANRSLIEIQNLLDAPFGHLLLVLTDCTAPKGQRDCSSANIIAKSKIHWTFSDQHLRQALATSEYSIITDQLEAGQDWAYKRSKEHQFVDKPFEPNGNIIGRLHYIRQPKPSLLQQLAKFNNPSNRFHSDIKFYSEIIKSEAKNFIIFLFFYILIIRYWRKQKIFLNIQRRDKQELRTKKMEVNEINHKLNEKKAKEIKLEKDKQSLEDELKFAIDDNEDLEQKLKRVTIQLGQVQSEQSHLIAERDAASQEADNLKQKQKFKTHKEDQPFEWLIEGINLESPLPVKYHPKVSADDIAQLLISGYKLNRVCDLLRGLLKTPKKTGEFTRRYEKLRTMDIYHNKKGAVRVYFHWSDDAITIISVLPSDKAPHQQGDKGWKQIVRRLKDVNV